MMSRAMVGGAAVAVFGSLCVASSAVGQLVDRGEFRLSVNGVAVGTEEFVIQRSGSGAAQTTLARGTVSLTSGGSITTHLQVTGPSLSVFRYSVQVSGEGERTVNIARIGDRLQARTVAPWGEELREYRATATTLLLDRGIAHHHFLLGGLLDAPPSSVHTVAPLSEAEASLTGLQASTEVINVGGESMEVRKLSFESPTGSREAWFDASGRLVRVANAATGFLAERTPSS